MDVASRALVEPLPDGIPDTFPARAAHFNVALATLYARASATFFVVRESLCSSATTTWFYNYIGCQRKQNKLRRVDEP